MQGLSTGGALGRRGGSWARALAATTVLALLGAALLRPVPADAQDGSVTLGQGAWTATKGAAGVLTYQDAEASVVWVGELTGTSVFAVVAGSSSGSWTWTGGADMLISTPQGDVPMALQSVAGGPLSGTGSGFTMTGEQTTTGSGSFMGITTDIGANVAPVDPIDVRFVDASCWHAFGDWTTSLDDMAEESGFAGSLTGWYIASPLGSIGEDLEVARDLNDRYDALAQQVRALLGSGGVTGPALVDALPLIDEATRLESEASELQDTCAFQDGAGLFATPLTSTIASLVLALATTLGPNELFNASVLLANVGAAGDSASRVLAGQLEQALAEQAQMWHDVYVTTSGAHPDGRACSVTEPCMVDPGQVLDLHLAAGILGFDLTVEGVPVSYNALLTAGAPR
ncbi:MAG: hypothetical protein JJT89_06235 [Nitriliruptoraceae bacterium]|nr:hypothetical protein [Nitriliruptoraceae bacterium]